MKRPDRMRTALFDRDPKSLRELVWSLLEHCASLLRRLELARREASQEKEQLSKLRPIAAAVHHSDWTGAKRAYEAYALIQDKKATSTYSAEYKLRLVQAVMVAPRGTKGRVLRAHNIDDTQYRKWKQIYLAEGFTGLQPKIGPKIDYVPSDVVCKKPVKTSLPPPINKESPDPIEEELDWAEDEEEFNEL